MNPVLVADHPALDFVGTVAERTTTRVDRLTAPAALDGWLVDEGVLDEAPRATADDLAAAVRLREALYTLLRAATAGEAAEDVGDGAPPVPHALPRDALAVVNAAAAGPAVTVTLTPDGRLLRTGDVTAALAHIARAGAEVIGGPDRARLRWCADTTCTHPFLDRSRAGRRRWCGMAGCGDRAKARAYRARRRAD
ncbi:MAG TPA: ABATE domain-containing protein [Pseudonocardia sp.]